MVSAEVPVSGDSPRRPARAGRRSAAAAPVARFEPGRVAEPRHRNPVWLLAGLLLVVLSALGGVLLFASREDRVPVLVATRDLAPGDAVSAADFRIVRIAVDGSAATLDPDAVAAIAGQHVVGPIPQGTVIHAGLFTPDVPLGSDEIEIGAALDPGELPRSGIPIGAPVELLVTGGDRAPTATAADVAAASVPPDTPPAARSIGIGTVSAVEERASGQVLVTVRMRREVGLIAAQAGRDDRLTLGLVGGED